MVGALAGHSFLDLGILFDLRPVIELVWCAVEEPLRSSMTELELAFV